MSHLPDLPHLIIRASAGTGKTYQLTHKYLQLVRENAHPQNILATTFTRKAAYEILERVLTLAAENAEKDTTQRIHLKQLAQNLHKLMISTLDSLFQKMGRCFAMELKLPANAQIMDTTDFALQQLQMQAMDQVLSNNPPEVLLDLMRRLYHSEANSRVFGVLQNVVNDLYDIYKQAPEQSQWSNYNCHGFLEGDHLSQVIQIHQSLKDELPKNKNGKPNAVANKAWLADLQLIAEEQWKIFLTKGIAKKICENSSKFGTAELSETMIRTYTILVDHARGWLLNRELQLNLARYELAKQYSQVFDQLRQDARILMHNDVPDRLEKVFAENESPDDFLYDLAYRMDQKIDHMMLDEFQDTSLQQWTILEQQASEICSHVDEYASRRFFCVGDVKQAIYGWRGGCAEIFNHIGQTLQLPDEASISLNESYRSSQIVLDAINYVFNGIDHNDGFSADQLVDWASQWKDRFESHTAANDLPGYVHFQVTGNAPEDSSEDFPLTYEADTEEETDSHTIDVCNQIASLQQQAPNQSIGVLVWTNKQASQLLTRLRWLGIDVASEGGVHLDDDPSVSCILAAMNMADRPDNSAAAFEVLNSPLGKYLGLTNYHHQAIRPVAWKIRQELSAYGYPRMIGQWANLLAKHSDARGSERLALLVQLAVNYEPNANLKPSDFASYVQNKQVPLSQQSPVQVMTIHKSKGLEFDAVVLPCLTRSLGRLQQQTTYITRQSPTDPIEYVYASGFDALRKISPELEHAHHQEWQRRFSDDLCGLYVALTRAKHALYLLAEPLRVKADGKLAAFGYRDNSAAAILRHTFVPPEDLGPDEGHVLFTHGDPDWHHHLQSDSEEKTEIAKPDPHQTCEIKIKFQKGKRSLPRISPSALEGTGKIHVADLLALKKSSGQSRGTVIHRLFEQIDWLSDNAPLPNRDDLVSLLKKDKLEFEDEFLDSFLKMLQMPAVIAALSKPADWDESTCQLWQEKNFAVVMNGRLVQGQLDRVHVWPDRALILDYKTDIPPKKGFGPLVDHYRPQLQAYCKSVAAMRHLPLEKVQAKLVFVRDGVVREV